MRSESQAAAPVNWRWLHDVNLSKKTWTHHVFVTFNDCVVVVIVFGNLF